MIGGRAKVVVVGGGFTGLSAAYELAKSGVAVTVLENDPDIGGLAAAFDVGGEKLDRFYHHWFTNDLEVMGLIDELGMAHSVRINPTNTGLYYANRSFRLSSPLDLLRFKPLPFFDRVRLGLLVLKARRVKKWQSLEDKTAAEWIIELGGRKVYEVVWEPLLKGKFGRMAERISAVWFWNKLKLRGGSRGKGGGERLVYFKGGFVALAEAMAAKIRSLGGVIKTRCGVRSIEPHGNEWRIVTEEGDVLADKVIVTPALPIVAEMLKNWAPGDYLGQLRRIEYLANVCLVLELDRSLSDTYWLNVNDTSFPFVGVIEHTNFESPETYGGRHIVYLSKYLPEDDRLYGMSADDLLEFSIPHLQRMFPAFQREWVQRHHVWRARWAQPVVEKRYSRLIPPTSGPGTGLYLASMAQVYPEDRGTNYAVREGRKVGRLVADSCRNRAESLVSSPSDPHQ